MNFLDLETFKNKARDIQNKDNISFNQSLQTLSKSYAYSNYQAIKSFNDKYEFIATSIEEKSNPYEYSVYYKLHKALSKNWNEIEKLQSEIESIKKCAENFDEDNDDDYLMELDYKASEIARQIMNLILEDSPFYYYSIGDNNEEYNYEEMVINLYTRCSYNNFHNDIGGQNADFSFNISSNDILNTFYYHSMDEDGYFEEWLSLE